MAYSNSIIDEAYKILKGREEVSFEELWQEITTRLQLSETSAKRKISSFYTQLIVDGRFVTVGENVWVLKEKCTFDKIHIDMNDVYADDEDEDYDEDDDEYYDDDDEDDEDDEDEDEDDDEDNDEDE